MKAEIRKYFALMVSVFLIYLGIRYWDSSMLLIKLALGAASPLLIGCIIAYAVNILMSFYENRLFQKTKCKFWLKGKRVICMLLAFVSLLAILAALLILVIPELVNCAKYLIDAVPKGTLVFLKSLEDSEVLSRYAVELEYLLVNNFDQIRNQMGEGIKSIANGMGNMVNSIFTAVTTVFSGLITALLSFIFSIYLLTEKEKLGRQFKRVLSTYVPKHQRVIEYIIKTFDDCFHHFIVGQCMEAIILGSLCALGMSILRLPYALMIGSLIGFTALIPVAGAYIGAGVGAFMILTVSPVKALIFLIFIVILQQVEGNVIYPKVVGNSIGLPGMWVLAAVTVGGGLLGIGGMMFAVPIAAAVYHLIQTDIRKRNHEL